MPEEIEATLDLDNSDVPFEKALDRLLFDGMVPLTIETLRKMQGDYGQYWELRTQLSGETLDTDKQLHAKGTPLTLLINVPGADASEGQKRAYAARLAELQVAALGLDKPDSKLNMKLVEGKSVVARLSVYTNPTSGKSKQQVDRFTKVPATAS
jgi:hypothetical protein